MGSGKSSAAIKMMQQCRDRRFLYITPYTDEVARILAECHSIGMQEPLELPQFRNSKVVHTEWLMQKDIHIASTHQAFVRYDPSFLDVIRTHHYTLIVDENISPLQPVKVSHSYIAAAKQAGFLDEIMDGVYRLHNKENRGDFDERLFYIMQSHDLIVVDSDCKDKAYYWLMPPEFMLAFDDVYILTYMFEGQGLYAMLKMYDLPYTYIGIDHTDDSYAFAPDGTYVPPAAGFLRDYIHIIDNPKMNAIGSAYYALSKTQYKRGKVDCAVLRKHVTNLYKNMYPTDSDCRMWSTFADYKDDIKGNGYASRFRALNLRATNKEADSTVLAYLVNLFVQRGQAIFFQRCGAAMSDELYALSTMVQWIWRSAVRNGHPIILYLPSHRMRDLLTVWMDDLAAGVDPKQRYLKGTT